MQAVLWHAVSVVIELVEVVSVDEVVIVGHPGSVNEGVVKPEHAA